MPFEAESLVRDRLIEPLREYARAKRSSGTIDELPFAVKKHAKVAKVIEQFVMREQIVRILRMANSLLIDQIGIEEHVTAVFHGAFDLRDERALKIINIHDEIVLRVTKP